MLVLATWITVRGCDSADLIASLWLPSRRSWGPSSSLLEVSRTSLRSPTRISLGIGGLSSCAKNTGRGSSRESSLTITGLHVISELGSRRSSLQKKEIITDANLTLHEGLNLTWNVSSPCPWFSEHLAQVGMPWSRPDFPQPLCCVSSSAAPSSLHLGDHLL